MFPYVVNSKLIKSSSIEVNVNQMNGEEQINSTKLNLKYLEFDQKKNTMPNGFYQFIQSIQTQKFSTKDLKSSALKCKTKFEYMCRGFWIKMHSSDFDKLTGLKFVTNGNNSYEVDIEQIVLITQIKLVCGYKIIFINLQPNKIDWNLSTNFDECKKIYSNSFNLSRIDSFAITLNFNTTSLSENPITISSIYSNILGMEISNLNKHYSIP